MSSASAPPLRPLDHCDRTLKEDSHAYAQQPTAPPPRERPAPRASLPHPDRGVGMETREAKTQCFNLGSPKLGVRKF